MTKKSPKLFRYIHKLPGVAPEVREGALALEEMQAMVGGGYVEALPGGYMPSNATFDVYINEEGLLKNMTPNLTIGDIPIVGPVIILAHDGEGETRSLTAEEVAAGLAWLGEVAIAAGDTARIKTAAENAEAILERGPVIFPIRPDLCPKCGGPMPDYPGAISRRDNATEICSDCGAREAMEDAMAQGRLS